MPAAEIPGWFDGIAVRPVSFSKAELQAYKDRLDALVEKLTAPGVTPPGVTLASWGVDVPSNSLAVAVVGDPVVAKDVLAAKLANPAKDARAVPLSVSQVNELPTLASRTASYQPHWGGARIYTPVGSQYEICTSGLPWVKNGGGYITSAAHCGTIQSPWQTDAGTYGTAWFSMKNQLGTNRTDVAILTTDPPNTGGSLFYVGPPGSNGAVYQGYYFPSVQTGVYGLRTSGAISGEQYRGGGNVLLVDRSVYYGPSHGTYHHLNLAECSVVPGDSGGPVFAVGTGGSIIAAGMIAASNGPNQCWYTPVNQIIATFGGTPMG